MITDTGFDQQNALVAGWTMRINAQVHSAPTDTAGPRQHRPELEKVFCDEATGAKGTVKTLELGKNQFRIYLRGTDKQGTFICDVKSLEKKFGDPNQKLGKDLPGEITAIHQEDESIVIDYDSTPDPKYVECAQLTWGTIKDLLDAEGPVAKSDQRFHEPISNPGAREAHRAGLKVTRCANERGFAALISPNRIYDWSEKAMITVLKAMAPAGYDVITVGDNRSEHIVVAIIAVP